MTEQNNREFVPNITTEQALGLWLVEQGRVEVPDHLRPYLDYKAIGIGYRIKHEGVFQDGGYSGIFDETPTVTPKSMLLMLTTSEQRCPLVLPASEMQLERVKQDLGIEKFSQAVIASIEYMEPVLNRLVPSDFITVEEANELAICIQEIKVEGEMTKFYAALEAEKVVTFHEVVNIAMDLDDYEVIPEDMDEYGKQVLRRIGADDEVIDAIDGYMDFARLGEDTVAENGVRRTDFGLIQRLSVPFKGQGLVYQQML